MGRGRVEPPTFRFTGIGTPLLTPVLASVMITTVDVPERPADRRAFDSAADCPTAPKAPADCLWEQEFTVSGIRLYRG